MRRIMIAMSQEKLGDALGVGFQQVQKYEQTPIGLSPKAIIRMDQPMGGIGV
jgi:transcriptional regulator with XRE-family HTH domain